MERFLGFASSTFSVFSIYLGDRLGLYRSLAESGPATSAELAARTGAHARIAADRHFFFRFYRLRP